MGKKGPGNVNHDAHFWGAIYGASFAFILDRTHGADFLYQIMHPM